MDHGIFWNNYDDDVDLQTFFQPENEALTLTSLEQVNSDLRICKRVADNHDDDPIQIDHEYGSKRVKLGSELNPQTIDLDCDQEKTTAVTLSRKMTKLSKIPNQTLTKQNRRRKSDVSRNQFYSGDKKQKASNFGAKKLQIGSWQRISRREGDLVAKCYYAKKKFVWEILEGALKKKIEMQWSDIIGIRSSVSDDEFGILEIELKHPPMFFQEIDPQPKKHTLWEAASDFTDGQAPICRIHTAMFPLKILQKHYEQILQSDEQLRALSKKQFPSKKLPYFDHQNTEISFKFNTGYSTPNFLPITNHEYQQQEVLLPNMTDIDFGQIDERGTNNMFINQTPTFPSQILASELLPCQELFNPNIQQNCQTAENCNFDCYNMVAEQNVANPINYYGLTNTNVPNLYGVHEFGNPVSWFQPQDFDNYNMAENVDNDDLLQDLQLRTFNIGKTGQNE